jgi:serine/threonine-protein kinase
MADVHPKTIGRYEVLHVLGKGAMGVVYKAVDPVIDREVAIKTIKLSLSEEELAFYEARFAQEIKTVGKLNHPHIVTIYDVGRTDEYAYMAMEFIEGPELKMLMGGRPLHVATSVDLIAQTAEGLAFAHARDIVHRDVKPSNVMIVNDEDGMVAKITDFGIARAPSSAVKTMTGMILGSPRYMSPEQVIGKNVGPHSDIFSLGVVLYEMLAGVAPFDADSVSSIMYQTVHVREEPLTKLNGDVPDAVAQIVSRALAKSVEDRYASMKEFSRALREAAKALPAPLATLPLAPIAPRGPTMPPPVELASAPEPEARLDETHQLSPQFDSLEGTMRLAALTDATLELTRVMKKPELAPAPIAEPETPQEPFPVARAAILGSLAAVAVILGVVLAM